MERSFTIAHETLEMKFKNRLEIDLQ